MRQTRHDTAVNGVADGSHHNGNRCCGLLRGDHRLGAPSENDVYFEANQIVRQLRKSFIAPSFISVLETHVFSLDIAEITESLSKGIDGRQRFERQDTDGDYFPCLLRARRERPCCRRAAEKRDEVAAPHVWMAPAWQEIIWRAAQRSLAVMCPACSRSPDGLLALMESANRGLITRAGSMSQ